MTGERERFLEELKLLMQNYGVVALTYTIDDDGLHAYGHTFAWELGFPIAELKE